MYLTSNWRRIFILIGIILLLSPKVLSQTFTDGDFNFKVTGEGTCSVTGTSLTSGDLIIPGTATDSDGNTYIIISIGNNAFKDCTGLTGSLIIPEGVTSIGDDAFRGCSGIEIITFQGVGNLTMGWEVFKDCSSLERVNISSLSKWCRIVFTDRTSNPLGIGAKLYIGDQMITDVVIPNGKPSRD